MCDCGLAPATEGVEKSEDKPRWWSLPFFLGQGLCYLLATACQASWPLIFWGSPVRAMG